MLWYWGLQALWAVPTAMYYSNLFFSKSTPQAPIIKHELHQSRSPSPSSLGFPLPDVLTLHPAYVGEICQVYALLAETQPGNYEATDLYEWLGVDTTALAQHRSKPDGSIGLHVWHAVTTKKPNALLKMTSGDPDDVAEEELFFAIAWVLLDGKLRSVYDGSFWPRVKNSKTSGADIKLLCGWE